MRRVEHVAPDVRVGAIVASRRGVERVIDVGDLHEAAVAAAGEVDVQARLATKRQDPALDHSVVLYATVRRRQCDVNDVALLRLTHHDLVAVVDLKELLRLVANLTCNRQ